MPRIWRIRNGTRLARAPVSMLFASPIWLLALLPWLGAVGYLLRGYRPVRRVPFLMLWPMEQGVSLQRRRHPPRLSVVLMLLAMLVAVLSLSRPQWGGAGRYQPPVVLVDGGISLLPEARRSRLADAVGEALSRFDPGTPVTIEWVPGDSWEAPAAGVRQALLSRAVLPVDTSQELERALSELLREGKSVVLVSGASPGLTVWPAGDARRLLVLHDDQEPANAGISRLSLSLTPSPELMLWLYNDTQQTAVVVEISGWERAADKALIPLFSLRRSVELPPRGGSAPRVVDLGSSVKLPEIVGVRLLLEDEVVADNEAWLVRRNRAVRPMPRGSLPPALSRLLTAYGKVRGVADAAGSAREITVACEPLGADENGLVLDAGALAAGEDEMPLSDAHIEELTELRELPLPRLAAFSGTAPPGRGWRTLVALQDRPLVAWREAPQRQIWVGFWSKRWSESADFAVFYAKLLDWVGGGGASYEASVLQMEAKQLRKVLPAGKASSPSPGVYEAGDGRLLALNAPALARMTSTATTRALLATPGTLSQQLGGLSQDLAAAPLAPAGWIVTTVLLTSGMAMHAWRRRSRHLQP